ncbi:methyl-accepting chemotaxis protein [Bacillus sp. EAC]|uniref:methyl-accepting chemotaxis protein n=1 Tax=Bacillus sp. EAC TaxID=1978338 RepID=UPI000B4376C3|nr:methyl-accepting chemotaxis protein [Bacillus sp. EAC]
MIRLKNIRISGKYGIVTIGTISIFVVSSALTFGLLNSIHNEYKNANQINQQALMAEKLSSTFYKKYVALSAYATFQDQASLDSYRSIDKSFLKSIDTANKTMDNKEIKKSLGDVMDYNNLMNDILEKKIVPAISERNDSYVKLLVQQAYGTQKYIDGISSKIIKILGEKNSKVDNKVEGAIGTVKTVLILAVLISALISSLALYITNRLINGKMNKVLHSLNEISKGNLSVENEVYDGKDEIAVLSNSTNKVKENLLRIVRQMNSVSTEMNGRSNELTQSASDVQKASQQIAATMQELAAGSGIQADSSNQMAEMMSDFNDKMAVAGQAGEMLKGVSNEVQDRTNLGYKQMNESLEQMTIIHDVVKGSVENVEQLVSHAKSISKVIKVIRDIADQTNLLALNASIEAARAGEAGRGFAVVADEVRRLAEGVKLSVQDITSIVQTIQTEASTMATSLNAGYKEVEKGTQSIEATGETFNGINTRVESMNLEIQEIASTLFTMQDGSMELMKFIEQVAAVTEESVAGVQQTAASVEEQSATMDDVASSAGILTQLSGQLDQVINQFIIDDSRKDVHVELVSENELNNSQNTFVQEDIKNEQMIVAIETEEEEIQIEGENTELIETVDLQLNDEHEEESFDHQTSENDEIELNDNEANIENELTQENQEESPKTNS